MILKTAVPAVLLCNDEHLIWVFTSGNACWFNLIGIVVDDSDWEALVAADRK